MTKADKHMGVIPKKYRRSSEKPTPAVAVGRNERGRFGYVIIYQFGRRQSKYTRWFATAIQRDQSLSIQIKRTYVAGCEKVERCAKAKNI